MRSIPVFTEEEKEEIRPFFINKKAWRDHIKRVSQLFHEIHPGVALEMPIFWEDDFLAKPRLYFNTELGKNERKKAKRTFRDEQRKNRHLQSINRKV